MAYFVGIDLGTTNIKAVVYDASAGRVVDIASRATPTHHPKSGWSEHDPEEMWRAVAFCLRAVIKGRQIDGAGISSMAEAGVAMDGDMNPLYPIIAWFDRRTEAQAAWWEAQLTLDEMHAISGQRVSTSFGVTKWMWVRDNLPDAAERLKKWLSLPDYILWRLTGELATDYTIASRTLLFNQGSRDWSERMLELAELKKDQLPPVFPGGTVVGKVSAQAHETTGLPEGTPCVLGGQDHLCGALAAGLYRPGMVIDSSGTAQAVLMLLPEFITSLKMAEQTYACYASVLPGYYTLKGGLKAAGGGIAWVAKQLTGLIPESNRLPYEQLEALARKGVGKHAGPVWLPHLNGAGSPEGDRDSMGAMVGVNLNHDQGDIFRGFLESLAFCLRKNVEEMSAISGQTVNQLVLVGGGTRLGLLSQLKSDVLGIPVQIPKLPEASASGAPLLAGIGTGNFASPVEAVESLRYEKQNLEPEQNRMRWYDDLYQRVYHPLYETLWQTNRALKTIQLRVEPGDEA